MIDPVRYSVDAFGFATAFRCVRTLCQRWREAQRGGELPPFEEIGIGALGDAVDDVAVCRQVGDELMVTRMGDGFRRTLGVGEQAIGLGAVSDNYRVPLAQAVRLALREKRPVLTTARCVADGSVGACEFLALPLQTRWRETLVLGFLRQRPETHDLIDAVYRATADGLLALAAVDDQAGEPDFQIVSLNASAAAFLGQSEMAICWTMLSQHLRHHEDRALLGQLRSILRDEVPRHFEFSLKTQAGSPAHFQISAAPVGDLLALALTDVTAIRQREQAVRLLFENNPMPLILCDPAGLRVIEANDACLDLLGYPAGQLRAMTLFDLHPVEEHDDLVSLFRPGAAKPGSGLDLHHRTADGRLLNTLVYRRDHPFGDRVYVLASIVDVTEQRKAEARIVHLAHYDAVTGLANRNLFRSSLTRHLAEASRSGRRVAVHCIDLDRFKQVNDTFGHPMGDALLARVAKRLSAVGRSTDLIARLGGDEFAIVQVGIADAQEASALARRLLGALSQPYEIDGQCMTVGASIGIAIGHQDGDDPDALLKSADIALYRSKAVGRGSFAFFEPEMDRALRDRRRLEQELRDALSRGEFRLAYQPSVDVATRRIVGCEALLRWTQPERGAVPPLDFIPLAEEIGLIVPIGEWVLHQACAEAVSWPSHLRLAVNLSPVQFRSPGLVASIEAALAATGFAATRLELEITETVLLADSEANLAVLRQLRALGVKISIDDFGIGYSSLSYLRRFPFDKLKIDRSFVSEVNRDHGCRAIVRAVTGLAADLGVVSLAEGVETEEEFACVAAQGCSEVQGYLVSRPLFVPELRRLFAAAAAPADIAA